mmetsp:Transcript_21026/g.47542  ORF Transcript_21026/g.47542 Transcript_21026/m.47542 type:complete len:169 (-) Transcript_21026:722-1228(-)
MPRKICKTQKPSSILMTGGRSNAPLKLNSCSNYAIRNTSAKLKEPHSLPNLFTPISIGVLAHTKPNWFSRAITPTRTSPTYHSLSLINSLESPISTTSQPRLQKKTCQGNSKNGENRRLPRQVGDIWATINSFLLPLTSYQRRESFIDGNNKNTICAACVGKKKQQII